MIPILIRFCHSVNLQEPSFANCGRLGRMGEFKEENFSEIEGQQGK